MPFPFLPGGLLLALTVLGGAFAVFGAALHLLDRAASSARGTIATGLAAGIRSWSRDGRSEQTQGPGGHASASATDDALRPFRLVGVRARSNPDPSAGASTGGQEEPGPGPSRAVVEEVVSGGAATDPVHRRPTARARVRRHAPRQEP